jgi:hypothetical protein
MDPDDDAVERLSDIRDCTYERAHEICLLVHARQDDPKSTAHDIADALIYIRKKNLSDSVRSITKWARKVTDGRIDPERERPTSDMQHQASNITPSEDANSASDDASKDRPDIERFEGAEDDEAFINWIDRNRSWGFVLNLRGDDKNPTLHTPHAVVIFELTPRKTRSRLPIRNSARKMRMPFENESRRSPANAWSTAHTVKCEWVRPRDMRMAFC